MSSCPRCSSSDLTRDGHDERGSGQLCPRRSAGAGRPLSPTWRVDETYVKILGNWHYLDRGVDQAGQVLDCWLSRTRDLTAATAFFRRTISSTGCIPEHMGTDKATFYPSVTRTCAPGARSSAESAFHTPKGSPNSVQTNCREGRLRGGRLFGRPSRHPATGFYNLVISATWGA